MITTSTGAKKIEGTDNWRLIFDAHNDTVTAYDSALSTQSEAIAKQEYINTLTTITDLLDIPLNSKGRIKLGSSVSPYANDAIVNYICYGSYNKITLEVSIAEYNVKFINTYSSNAWTGWKEFGNVLKSSSIPNETTQTIDSAYEGAHILALSRVGSNKQVVIMTDYWSASYYVVSGTVPSGVTITKSANSHSISVKNTSGSALAYLYT